MLQADIYGIRYQFYMFSYGVAVFTVHTFLYGNIDFFLVIFFDINRLFCFSFSFDGLAKKKYLFTVELLKILKHGIWKSMLFSNAITDVV